MTAADIAYVPSPAIGERALRLAPWALLVAAAVFGAVLLDAGRGHFIDPDSYYHLRMAAMLRAGVVQDTLVQASGTTLATSFADREWLYHALLAASGAVAGGEVLGARLLQGALQTGVVLSVALAARALGARFGWLAGLLVLGAGHSFLWRLAMLRPHLVAEILLPWIVVAAVRDRRGALFVLSALYAAAYSGSLLAPLTVAAVTLAACARGETWSWRTPAASALGVAAGLTLHPWFPATYEAWFLQNLCVPWTAWTAAPGAYKVPQELGPESLGNLLSTCPIAVAATAFAVLAAVTLGGRLGRASRLLAAAALLTGAMTLWSVRFVEYFAPFAAIACTTVLSDLLAAGRLARRTRVILGAAAVGAASVAAGQWAIARDALAARDAPPSSGAADWVAASDLPAGAQIVQLDWEDFPLFFHRAPRVRCWGGHDPVYGLVRDERRWRLLDDLHDGRIAASAAMLRSEFQAAAVIVPKHCPAVIAALREDSQAREEYSDVHRSVFRLTGDTTVEVRR